MIERDYSVKGLGLDNSSMLTEVPVSFEDYMNQEQEEYSDDPSKFKPLSKDEKIDNDEEILPWNIECVAGDPRNNEYSGKNVKVAVIDSGIDVHNDLNTKKWIDFSDTVKGYKPVDNNGHGTQMAGVISAQKNGYGMIGISYDADVYSVKILDKDNEAYISSVIKGIEWCIDNNVDIINMSFGLDEYSEILHSVIKKAYNEGILLVAASGNDNRMQYPARFKEVLSVGGVDKDLNRTYYSTETNSDVYAPAEDCQTTGFVGSFAKSSGTSIAAAHVSGVAAAVKSIDISMTNKKLMKILKESTVKNSDKNGCYGIINYSNAVNIYLNTGTDEEDIMDIDDIEDSSNNEAYVNGSWSKDSWQNESSSNGTGHYSMINGLDTEYFAAGASDYTSKCYNRWIVADSAYRVDTLEQFKPDSEVWKKDKNLSSNNRYSPYHANTHYSTGELCAPINFLYELARRRIVLGKQLSMNSSSYNNKDEYKGVYIPVDMKKKIVDNMQAMYSNLKAHYGSTINMDLPISRGYMVLGVLLHLVEDFYCHRAKVTWDMLSASADGYTGWYDVFGETCNDSHIYCGNLSGNGNDWSNYWRCLNYIKTYGGMPINRLKERLNSSISINCNNKTYNSLSGNQAYEDNPFFYSNRYAASLYVTKSVLQDMKDSKNNTPLYGFDSWGVPLFEDKFVYDFGGQSW